MLSWDLGEQRSLLLSLIKWAGLASVVGILAGSASALFLYSLEAVTQWRVDHPALLFLLPLGGGLVGWLYQRFGGSATRGFNLILDQLEEPTDRVPLRMAPMVLFGTLVTHLFGGSAGREGTAIQMGGSLADTVARVLRLNQSDRRLLLMSGMAGGFGSLFGTPLAGTVFAMEVLRRGSIRYDALVPCLIAALVGKGVTTAWGVGHTHYAFGGVPPMTPQVFMRVGAAGAAFGLAALLFVELGHLAKWSYGRLVSSPVFRPVVGGLVVIGLTTLLGTRDYSGLGIPMIQAAFEGVVPPLAFFWKSLLTALTLGAGFQGGEVTPLFFVGATLGHTLAIPLALPSAFLAGLGFVAVFAGAANTPLACILMGVELFGAEALPFLGLACVIAYILSGDRSIYAAQRMGVSKRHGTTGLARGRT